MANGIRKVLGNLVRKIREDGAAKALGGNNKSWEEKTNSRIARLGLTQRQQRLSRLWAWYRAQTYDSRKLDWNGDEIKDEIEIETIASTGVVPPGFQQSATEVPLEFRKPTAPYALPRVIVHRFTGLLFGEQHAPKFEVSDDPQTEDWINAVLIAANFRQRAKRARNMGGAMGSWCVGFKFRDGAPVIEVHDPRWCFPQFVERGSRELRRLEIKYVYPVERLNPENGEIEEHAFWYRRVIDAQTDTQWDPVPVEDGDEPAWPDLKHETVTHGLGFVPVEWGHNLEGEDDEIDGDPDCEGTFDAIKAIDALRAQANKGTLKNADPTLVVNTAEPLDSVQKGSDHALKFPNPGEGAKYMEMTGGGLKFALDLADKFREGVLEVCQVVLDHPEAGAQKTATEVERVYSSMVERVGDLQVMYGGPWLRLAEKMIKAGRMIEQGQPVQREDGTTEVRRIKLPPRTEKAQDGSVQRFERELGPGGTVAMKWPPIYQPTLDEITKAIDAMSRGVLNNLIDQDTAVRFVARFLGVDAVDKMIKKIEAERAQRDAEAQQQMAQAMGGAGGPPGGGALTR